MKVVPPVGALIEEVNVAALATVLPRFKLEAVAAEGEVSVLPLFIVTCPEKLESKLSETSIVPPIL
jgi:hypothetical protein